MEIKTNKNCRKYLDFSSILFISILYARYFCSKYSIFQDENGFSEKSNNNMKTDMSCLGCLITASI